MSLAKLVQYMGDEVGWERVWEEGALGEDVEEDI